jgi:hypothetical protein
MNNTCVITFCDKNYLNQAQFTINALRTVGEYFGTIVLMVGDDLKDLKTNDSNLIIKYFPTIDRTEVLKPLNGISTSDGRDLYRQFQWHKIYCFDTYFKQWEKCFVIDAGMHIMKPINKFFNLNCKNKLLAHSDAYPTYQSRLSDMFEKERFKNLYEELLNLYDLNVDYFQCTMLLYDTNIIKQDTFARIKKLADKFINTRTNEQPFVNIVLNLEDRVWTQIQLKDDETYYYDFLERHNLTKKDYIMLKYPRT